MSEKLKNLTLVGVNSNLDGMGPNHLIQQKHNKTKSDVMYCQKLIVHLQEQNKTNRFQRLYILPHHI